ncbi:SDR family oxidoreductase [Micromonospora chokoriensis]
MPTRSCCPGASRRSNVWWVNSIRPAAECCTTAAHRVDPTAAVYCATKYAIRALTEGLRQESRDVRVTLVSPGYTHSELTQRGGDPQIQAAARAAVDELGMPASAVADAIAQAIAQPDTVDVSEIIMRSTAQG